MSLLRSLAIAFTRFSAIPMPRFEWKSEDTALSLVFFPLVGAVTGGIVFALHVIAVRLSIPEISEAFVIAAVPLAVSGGIHLDGYMDVSDAVNSWKGRRERLEILKDPHIGAFAVIALARTGLLYLAAVFSLVHALRGSGVAAAAPCLCFTVSRGLSTLAIMYMQNAAGSGSLYQSGAEASSRSGVVKLSAFVWIIASIAVMAALDAVPAMAASVAAVFSYIYYYRMSAKNFGGITGDLAGYFVVICEVNMLIMMALVKYL